MKMKKIKNKNYKLINFLRSVGKYTKLSKYSETLEKIFKKKCIKSLIHSLSNQIIIDEDKIFFSNLDKKEDEDKYYIYKK